MNCKNYEPVEVHTGCSGCKSTLPFPECVRSCVDDTTGIRRNWTPAQPEPHLSCDGCWNEDDEGDCGDCMSPPGDETRKNYRAKQPEPPAPDSHADFRQHCFECAKFLECDHYCAPTAGCFVAMEPDAPDDISKGVWFQIGGCGSWYARPAGHPDITAVMVDDVKFVRDTSRTSCRTTEELNEMLEDVVNALILSDAAIAEHGPLGTPPAELVKLVLDQKDKTIRMLKAGMMDANGEKFVREDQPYYHNIACQKLVRRIAKWSRTRGGLTEPNSVDEVHAIEAEAKQLCPETKGE